MGSQALASAVQRSMIELLMINRGMIEQGVDPSLQFACRRLQVRFAPAGWCGNGRANSHLKLHQARQIATRTQGSVAVEDGDWQKRSS